MRANLQSISLRCHLFEVAFAWELTKETIHLSLGRLQGGKGNKTDEPDDDRQTSGELTKLDGCERTANALS